MDLQPLQYLSGAAAGSVIGFTLGLIGGGGSILAVPLLVYFVGVPAPHVAVGTSAVAVAVNASINLIPHARRGSVRWRCAAIFTGAGVFGALLGSQLGKFVDGQRLLFLFGLLMLAVAAMMLKRRAAAAPGSVECGVRAAPKVAGIGAAAGTLSGFFGIGGGFLVVPSLMAATGMGIRDAIGSSLVAVAAFGFATSISYATSGLIDWLLTAAMIAGGIVGGVIGAAASHRATEHKSAMSVGFAAILCLVAAYVIARSGMAMLGNNA